MPTYTITTNTQPVSGGNFYLRYRNVSGGAWSSWLPFFSSPIAISTASPLYTNLIFEIYQDCKPGISATSTFTTNFVCTCGITNLSNLVVGTCNSLTNTYSISLDVGYSCMKNDLNVITSVIKVVIDGTPHYFNPTVATGTQTITVNNLVADSLPKTIDVTCIPS